MISPEVCSITHNNYRSSHGIGLFAGTVGVERLLKLFKKYDMKTTWFIPGHSLETFPKEMAAVRDAGHEIGLVSFRNPGDRSCGTESVSAWLLSRR